MKDDVATTVEVLLCIPNGQVYYARLPRQGGITLIAKGF